MFDSVKTWFRPRRCEARKFGNKTACGWAAALRYDFAYFKEDPAALLHREFSTLALDADYPILIAAHDDPDIRILACVLAAVDSRNDCHNALIAALSDPLETVRRSAAIALVKMNTVAGLAAVVAGHRHGHGIRTQAAFALSEHGPAALPAIPALFALINYDDINWRSHSAAGVALTAIGQDAVPYLVTAIRNGSVRARYESAVALKQIGVPNELESLVAQILGPDFSD